MERIVVILNKFFSKKNYELQHTTELHSHLITNIDDGLKDLDESIDIIINLERLGFKKIITTPHIMSHRFPNTKDTILNAYKLLKYKLLQLNINIDLQVAAEYYNDEHFLDLINRNEIMTFGDNYMLFELSYQMKPIALEQTVTKLLKAGYKPILAHPERYIYYNSEAHYRKLKEMGLYLQINLNSTQNFYGKRAQIAVEKIINLGLVDFIGSDIHSKRYMDAFSNSLNSKIYSQIMSKNEIKNNYL